MLYCSSVTLSIHSTCWLLTVPVRARCVMALLGEAPCQCLTPGGHQTTSPALISCTGPSRLRGSTHTCGHDKALPRRVGVPVRARTRLEGDIGAAIGRGVVGRE